MLYSEYAYGFFLGVTARHYEIMFLVPEDQVEKVPDVIKKIEGKLRAPFLFVNYNFV